MKKLLALLLALVMVLSLCACGTGTKVEESSTSASSSDDTIAETYLEEAKDLVNAGDYDAAVALLKNGMENCDSSKLSDYLKEVVSLQTKSISTETDDSQTSETSNDVSSNQNSDEDTPLNADDLYEKWNGIDFHYLTVEATNNLFRAQQNLIGEVIIGHVQVNDIYSSGFLTSLFCGHGDAACAYITLPKDELLSLNRYDCFRIIGTIDSISYRAMEEIDNGEPVLYYVINGFYLDDCTDEIEGTLFFDPEQYNGQGNQCAMILSGKNKYYLENESFSLEHEVGADGEVIILYDHFGKRIRVYEGDQLRIACREYRLDGPNLYADSVFIYFADG